MPRPKIVYWDLETLPDPKEIYERIPSIGAWPGRTFKAELQSIMCFGYKIEGEESATSLNVWEMSNEIHNDAPLVHAAYEILHDADEIVTHNGKSFDLKVLNTRLALWGFPPLPKIHHVDTKVVCKSNLSLYSNSLDNAAKFYGIAEKMHFQDKWGMWLRIAFGDASPKDFKNMHDYCIQDVEVLQQLYHKTRPFHGTSGVNHNIFSEGDALVCNKCGSHEWFKNGYRNTAQKRYQRIQCRNCGTWGKLTKKGNVTAL